MKKQILLIQPPVEDFYSTDCRTQPLGLCYLAASIRLRFPDIDIIIYDAAAGKKQSIAWPGEFSYLKEYYDVYDKSPYKLFYQYNRFGKTTDVIREDLKSLSPFLIGISSLFTPYYRQSLEVAGICRDLFPDAKIVMGGHHATADPESLLFANREGIRGQTNENRTDLSYLVDYVIPGEGEIGMSYLVEKILKNKIDTISNMKEGAIVTRQNLSHWRSWTLQSPDIHNLPHPDFSGLNGANYSFDGKPVCFLVTSRGCPYRCAFCSIHRVSGNKYRRRKNDDILEEIQTRVNQGIRHIDIEDDHFSAHKSETHELLDRIIQKRWPLTFSAMNGLVYWSLDSELLHKMKLAGFSSVNLSFVSLDSDMIHDTGRPDEKHRFKAIVEEARQAGFLITAYLIIGRPGQSISEMSQTLRFLASLPVLIGASPYYMCPGTRDFENWSDDETIKRASEKYDRYFSARLTAMDIETFEFNRNDIYTLFKMSRVINHIKNGIDMGYPQDHDYYKSAIKIFTERKWYAYSSDKISELPVSERVISGLASQSLKLCGYKSDNLLNLAGVTPPDLK